jgi:hypothetical protein
VLKGDFAHFCQPNQHRRTAVRLFRHLFRFLDPRTQEILRTREELAELARMDVDAVSKVMGELGTVLRMR